VLCGDDTWICDDSGASVRYDVCDPAVAEHVTTCTAGGYCFLCSADGRGEVYGCRPGPQGPMPTWTPSGYEFACRP
jgi:hypothetical protein